MAGTNVNYVPTTPAEIAAEKVRARAALLKSRITGSYGDATATGAPEGAADAWHAQMKEMSGLTPDQLQALWRNRALDRSKALPDDVADIALRDAQTGLVTRARRGSRKESMLLGDFNAMPPAGGTSLLGG
ncbi:MAG: hypothetical protein Q8L48_16785 [Archangium sp.]|nr:hypothetical protein [Archangium sp.]